MKFVLVFQNVRATLFLRAMDVFEEWKVIRSPPVVVEIEPDVWEEKVTKIIEQGKLQPDYKIIGIVGETYSWYDSNVHVVSDGVTFTTIHNYLGDLRHAYLLSPIRR